MRKITAFQRRVYDATARIPRGKVASYAEVARAVGCGSARAVGGALRVNPFAPQVPCHRVVAANGSLRGFKGHAQGAELDEKRRLLEAEGIRFDALGRVRADHFVTISCRASCRDASRSSTSRAWGP